MARNRHPKKDVEAALRDMEAAGWTVTPTKAGHRWGKARCSIDCEESIWSTPRSPQNHAKRLRRAIANCDCDDSQENEDG